MNSGYNPWMNGVKAASLQQLVNNGAGVCREMVSTSKITWCISFLASIQTWCCFWMLFSIRQIIQEYLPRSRILAWTHADKKLCRVSHIECVSGRQSSFLLLPLFSFFSLGMILFCFIFVLLQNFSVNTFSFFLWVMHLGPWIGSCHRFVVWICFCFCVKTWQLSLLHLCYISDRLCSAFVSWIIRNRSHQRLSFNITTVSGDL